MDLEREFRSLIISKHLNFLIGSGVSAKSIGLMKDFDTHDDLMKKINIVSKKLINERCTKLVKENLLEYCSFVRAVVDILNNSNSRQTPKSVNIFTTNYDLFIEKAADKLSGEYSFVFNDGANGYFNRVLSSGNYNRTSSYRGLNDNYISEIPTISLIKPHGSVNWEKVNEEILIKNKVVNNPIIVPPTGDECRDTFMQNHYYEMLRLFQLELDKPQSVLVVIGFSFQDAHIAKMVKRALQNPEIMMFVFCYTNEDKEKYIDNLNISRSEHSNLQFITPNDFDSKKLSNKNYCTLKDLTNLMNGF